MNKHRPSLSEFSGYFNISKRDYANNIGGGDWEEYVLCDTNRPGKLWKSEDRDVKKSVADVLRSHGVLSSDTYNMIAGFWPLEYFSIEMELVDRTVRIWISSLLSIEHDLLNALSSLLSIYYPSWRILLLLPAYDGADIVIYCDSIRISGMGDYNQTVLEDCRATWLKSMTCDTEKYAVQFQSVNNSVPLQFMDAKKQIMLLQVFHVGSCPEDRRTQRDRLVFWFSTTGGRSGLSPHSINSLSVGGIEYKPKTRAVFGHLSNNRWQFIASPRAMGRVTLFDADGNTDSRHFEINGTSGRNFREWKFSGTFACTEM